MKSSSAVACTVFNEIRFTTATFSYLFLKGQQCKLLDTSACVQIYFSSPILVYKEAPEAGINDDQTTNGPGCVGKTQMDYITLALQSSQ